MRHLNPAKSPPFKEINMTPFLGHNYIGGQRSANGSTKLQSIDATTGEALPQDFYQATAQELDALGDDFVELVCRETALPAARIKGERGRTSGQMRLFATVLRRGDFYGARIDK